MIAIELSPGDFAAALARARRRRRAAVAGLGLLSAAAGTFMAWAPAWLAFTAAVGAASGWCRWLEHQQAPWG